MTRQTFQAWCVDTCFRQALCDEDDELDTWLRPRGYYELENVPVDEYEFYLATSPVRVDDPITWWRGHQTTFPKLAQKAFDLLSVLAMSAECERVFSQAKLTVSIRGIDYLKTQLRLFNA